MESVSKEEITEWFKQLQDNICNALEKADGKASFRQDTWQRDGGGGGRTRVIAEGNVIEKGGVNFSAVYGESPEKMIAALSLEKANFYATGVSIVIHPHNPMMPIIHMNVRYFEMDNGVFWFGGGIDLTPHYVDKQDATYFHQQLKNACDRFSENYYPTFKQWADDYFYLKHRKETRGIGGIFFDRLAAQDGFSKRDRWEFVKTIGETFAPTYVHFMLKNKDLPFGEKEQQWQKLRRGRYVEFNLLWDKGTKFGLDTDGRTESILMSLPPEANWAYDVQVEPNSNEEETQQLLTKGVNWV